MKNVILRNRYTLLLSTLIVYIVVLVVEGAITGREARSVEFENPYFDLNLNNMEELRDSNNADDSSRRELGGDA